MMERLTPQQRLEIVEIYFQNQCSVRQTYRALRPFYGRHNRPSEQVIRITIDRFRTTHTLIDNTQSPRRCTVRTEEALAAVERSITENPNLSIRQRAQELGLCPSTMWKIMRKDLQSQSSKPQLTCVQDKKGTAPSVGKTKSAAAPVAAKAKTAESKPAVCKEDKKQEKI